MERCSYGAEHGTLTPGLVDTILLQLSHVTCQTLDCFFNFVSVGFCNSSFLMI